MSKDSINIDFSKIRKEDIEIAIEHETLRITDNKLSNTNHPKAFEPKLFHKYITTDFAENQLELITPVFNNTIDLYNFSNTLYDIAVEETDDNEVLLCYSLPLNIKSDDEIKEATFGESEKEKIARLYRAHLTKVYGKRKQTISGIHFNLSINEELLLNSSKNDVYMKIARNYNKYKFLTVALLGASPVCDYSLFDEKVDKMVSIRNSHLGYRNIDKLNISYDSVSDFVMSVKEEIKSGKIVDEREVYSSIRIKTGSKHLLEDLKTQEIKYIEIRNVDLNPFEKGGISFEGIRLLKYIIIYCLVKDDNEDSFDGDEVSDFIAKTYDDNTIMPMFDEKITINEFLLKTLTDMLEIFKSLDYELEVIEKYIDDVKKGDFLYKKVYESIKKEGYENFLLNTSKAHKVDAYNNRFKLYGHENMELSTQILIKECIKNSIDVEILDEYDNFIKLSKNDNIQYIKQATKTSVDNYATVCAMENKVVTKKILDENNINVPKGSDFVDFDLAYKYALKLGGEFVVKPKSTNFGIGINIFEGIAEPESIKKAIEIAFSHDDTIIIEQFIKGNEYRFLVIGDETVGVLNRVPANVLGDGTKTIKELVDIKNLDPLRGKGYKTPLEKIVIDDNAKIYLKSQSLDENYIPKDGETIYLRQNSNVSTGGDSIDITDEIPQVFKDIAVNASKAIGASICGVDIMIEDYKDKNSNYSIIELNFNPAIHIHSYPYKGCERKIAKKILDLLKY